MGRSLSAAAIVVAAVVVFAAAAFGVLVYVLGMEPIRAAGAAVIFGVVAGASVAK